MCVNSNCPVRLECYRYIAVPNKYWQSCTEFKYDKNTGCSYFDPVWIETE